MPTPKKAKKKLMKIPPGFFKELYPITESKEGITRTPEQGLEIIRLFLEKLEIMSLKERAVITETIDMLNKPIFITNERS